LEICLNGWVGELITNNVPKTYMMEVEFKKEIFKPQMTIVMNQHMKIKIHEIYHK
jgi:hypothetical protein